MHERGQRLLGQAVRPLDRTPGALLGILFWHVQMPAGLYAWDPGAARAGRTPISGSTSDAQRNNGSMLRALL